MAARVQSVYATVWSIIRCELLCFSLHGGDAWGHVQLWSPWAPTQCCLPVMTLTWGEFVNSLWSGCLLPRTRPGRQTFLIPSEHSPVNHTGNVSSSSMTEWLWLSAAADPGTFLVALVKKGCHKSLSVLPTVSVVTVCVRCYNNLIAEQCNFLNLKPHYQMVLSVCITLVYFCVMFISILRHSWCLFVLCTIQIMQQEQQRFWELNMLV